MIITPLLKLSTLKAVFPENLSDRSFVIFVVPSLRIFLEYLVGVFSCLSAALYVEF